MLQNMRSASKSWIMRAFFAILVFCFVLLWGVGDVFKPGRMTDHSIATVGKVKIGTHEFIKETKVRAAQIQQQTGEQPDENTVKQSVLQSMIYNAFLDQEADHLGLTISDQQVVDMIRSAPAFQDKGGEFNKQIFEGYARSTGMTTKGFEEDLRQQMRRNQLLQLVSTGLTLPQTYLIPLFKWQHEKRMVDWATIQPSSFNKLPAPTVEEQKAFYEGHKDEFTRPEERDITLVILSEEALRKNIKLTDEETQAGFAARRGELKGPLPTKAESEKIIEELKAEKSMDAFNRLTTTIEDNISGGVTLEDLTKKHDLKLVKVEGLRRDGATHNKLDLSPDILIEAVEQGFKMQQGDEPFLSLLGNGEYIAARVDKIHESKLLPFEEVSKDIIGIVTSEKQNKAALDLAGSLVEKINSGAQLAQLAKDNKLELKTGISMARVDQKDETVPRGLRAIAFKTDLNKASVSPGDKGSFAVVVPRQIIEPKSEEIKDDEIKAFKTMLEQNMANDMLQQYWVALEKRYPVDINKAALINLQK